jgi:hypothetical protein
MTASFRRIDYSLRPAKHAERRMLCDVFRRLRPFGRIEEYVYVGFGSVWFSDFSLFHKALGVKDMVSIEQAEAAKERIEENKPFRISVDYRRSTEALPDLDWDRNNFIWLDYDDPLSTDMLLDMRAVARRAKSGTVLSVSVQCMKAPEISQSAVAGEEEVRPFDRFVTVFRRDRVPLDASEEDLYGWRYGALCRGILNRELESELAARNADATTAMTFKPICEIEYEDGAKMTTVVGVFCADGDARVDDCHFQALDFLTEYGAPVRIEVPKLTVREFRRLESQLPLGEGQELQLGTIPAGEAKRFSAMYRYLPNFAVVET